MSFLFVRSFPQAFLQTGLRMIVGDSRVPSLLEQDLLSRECRFSKQTDHQTKPGCNTLSEGSGCAFLKAPAELNQIGLGSESMLWECLWRHLGVCENVCSAVQQRSVTVLVAD